MTAVGKNIKNMRKKLDITQEELAEKINVTRQAVSNWENGKTEPDIETLTRIAQIFDISIDELVDGIPSDISILRGKKMYLKLGVIFISLSAVLYIISAVVKESVNIYTSTTYDMQFYVLLGFIIIPVYKILCGLGISFLLTYATGYYVKNKTARLFLIITGGLCFIFFTAYLFILVLAIWSEVSVINNINVSYYIFLVERPYLHIIAPVLIFYGIIKK